MAESQTAFNSSSSENPLINPPKLKFGTVPFAGIKPEYFPEAVDWAIARNREEFDAIKNNPEPPSFENTIEALEFRGEELNRVLAVYGTLTGANSNDELRELEQDINEKLAELGSEQAMDEVLFERIKAVYDARHTLNLDADQLLLLEDTYKDYERSGALLNPEDKARLKEINKRMSQLTTSFRQNLIRHKSAYKKVVGDKEELRGVPERALKSYKAAADEAIEKAEINATIKAEKLEAVIETAETIREEIKCGPREITVAAKQAADKAIKEAKDAAEKAQKAAAQTRSELEGKYLIQLEPYPTDILTHGENRALRQEIATAYGKLGSEEPYDNRPVVMEIVRLRHEKAQLLGYNNHADFVLSERMAGSQKAVEDFLQNNLNTYKPAAEEHLNDVKAYAKLVDDLEDFKPWDYSYYARRLKEEKYKLETEKLRPYFELGRVFEGFRKHIEKLFDVEMVDSTKDYPVYHDDVKVYEVKDKQTGDVKALFYADYYARPGAKRPGAWMDALRDRGLDKHGVDNIPIITNTCNFDRPTKGQPALLSLRDVTTLFHEGGHGFHGALGEGRYPSQTGTNVKWDFVELPSQLQENWVMEKEVLQSFARHYETDEVIPEEMIEKVREAGNFGSAYAGLRQTWLGLIDMAWHTADPDTIESVEALEAKVNEVANLLPTTSLQSTGFGHLFSSGVGYSAGYYSYKWAEVLEADIFEMFKENGLYNDDTRHRLRETIYSKGGTAAPMELFKAMRGREPDPDALFRREGLLPATPAAGANDNSLDAPAPKQPGQNGTAPAP